MARPNDSKPAVFLPESIPEWFVIRSGLFVIEEVRFAVEQVGFPLTHPSPVASLQGWHKIDEGV